MRSHLNIAAQIKKQNLNTATHQLQKLIATLRAKGISGTETSFNPMVFAQNSRYAKFQKAYASFTENQCFADLQFFTRFDAELTKISVHLGSPWNAALTFKKKYRSSRKP